MLGRTQKQTYGAAMPRSQILMFAHADVPGVWGGAANQGRLKKHLNQGNATEASGDATKQGTIAVAVQHVSS